MTVKLPAARPSAPTTAPKPSAPRPSAPPARPAAPLHGDKLGGGEALRRNAALVGAGLGGNLDLQALRQARRASVMASALNGVKTPALPPGPTFDPQVQAAAANVNAAYNSSTDPKERAKAVAEAVKENAKQFADNPELAAQFGEAIGPTMTKLGNLLGGHKNEGWVKGVLGSLAETGAKLGADATAAMGRALAKGLPDTDDLYFIDDALGASGLGLAVLGGLSEAGKLESTKDLGEAVSGFINVLFEMDSMEALKLISQLPPELLGPAALAFQKVGNEPFAALLGGVAAGSFSDEVSKAQDANDTMAQLTSTLNAELMHVPDSLKAQYQADFWAAHADEKQKATEANAALAKTLDESLPVLTQLAASNPEIAKALAGALKELARDPAQAQYVTDTIDGLARGGAFPPGFGDAEKALVEARNMASQSLAQGFLARGDSAGAQQVLEGTLEFLEGVKFVTTDVAEMVAEQLPALSEFTGVVGDAVRSGDFSGVTKYLLDGENAEKLDDIVKSNPALGNLIAGTSVALYLLNPPKDGVDAIVGLLDAGGAASELLSSGVSMIGRMTSSESLATFAESAEAFGKFLGKAAGAIGVVVGALETFQSIGGAISDPSLETVTSAVASSLTTVGGAIALFPGGQVVGLAVASIGLLITGFSALFSESPFEKQTRETETLLLGVLQKEAQNPYSGLSKLTEDELKQLASRLANSPIDVNRLMREGDLTVGQLADIALNSTLFQEVTVPEGALDVIQVTGKTGAELVHWLKEMSPEIGPIIDDVADLSRAGIFAEDAREEAEGQARKAGKSPEEVEKAGQAAYDRTYQKELKKLLLETLATSEEFGAISSEFPPPTFGL